MMRRPATWRAPPISSSCPACLGDLSSEQVPGVRTVTCTGCGLVVNRLPTEQPATPAGQLDDAVGGSASSI